MIAIGKYGGFEVAYRKGTTDESVIAHSFDNDIYFSGVPECRPNNGDVLIDVGAHIGTWSLLASSPEVEVYALEPCMESYNLLRINIALNWSVVSDEPQMHIYPSRLALSETDGPVDLFYDANTWGHSTVHTRHGQSESVPALSLSTFVKTRVINRCHFMRMNCEGAEFPVLLSTPADVLRRIECMLVLYHCDLWTENTESDLVSHLESAGFKCDIRNQTLKRGWIVATRN